ncbi:Pogo transposable element with KRAB domain [Takifugu flavidus]|uniref:Pogo transposable element with KRAB domain n=1 Tax=Takifugu flavidus TaxID=433684 RepID=A0A5C6MI56_9TELE|nr:Pogo transposable element with KRAB domain [Takifugu flavidus]
MPTPVTVHEKGEKSVILKSTGNEKSRVTVMLACLADGTKLPPYVVLKRKTVPKEAMPAGIIVRAQEKGWMETELVVDWLKVVWGRRRGGLRKKRNMLILDAFCGHLSDPVKKQVKAMNGDLVIIPGRNNKSAAGEIQKPPVRLLCEWILHAWDAVSPKSIIHGFKKCCYQMPWGSEDDVLWEEPEDVCEE